VGNNNYWCVKSSQSMISKTWKASYGTLAWAPTKNCLRRCKSRHKANLITTLNGHSFLSLYITNNFSAWVQHVCICLFTKIQNWDFFMEAIDKTLFTTRVLTIYSFASCIKCLFPKMKVYLPFPFEALKLNIIFFQPP
jgi:hypothetical protein